VDEVAVLAERLRDALESERFQPEVRLGVPQGTGMYQENVHNAAYPPGLCRVEPTRGFLLLELVTSWRVSRRSDMSRRALRYLPLLVAGLVVLGLAIRSTMAAIDGGEHTPNLVAAVAGAVAAAFIIGANVGRRSDE
jgi:peptidoglycan/LPS O-acetylase OafA/YrhL